MFLEAFFGKSSRDQNNLAGFLVDSFEVQASASEILTKKKVRSFL